jgi:hypothetical protein
VGHLPLTPAPVTSIPYAVLPTRRKDEAGAKQEDGGSN